MARVLGAQPSLRRDLRHFGVQPSVETLGLLSIVPSGHQKSSGLPAQTIQPPPGTASHSFQTRSIIPRLTKREKKFSILTILCVRNTRENPLYNMWTYRVTVSGGAKVAELFGATCARGFPKTGFPYEIPHFLQIFPRHLALLCGVARDKRFRARIPGGYFQLLRRSRIGQLFSDSATIRLGRRPTAGRGGIACFVDRIG